MHEQPCLKVRLPSIPKVAMRLLGALQDPDVPTGEIVELVQTDPAITAKILKAANSPLFGGGRSIDSVDRAVVWMGRHGITCLALGFSLSEKAREGGSLNRYYREYWLQSVIHALALECLAKRVVPSIRHTAFVTGLLMDIGRLAILQDHASRYTSLLDQFRSGARRLADLEQEELGKTHAQISAELFTTWLLPEAMVAAAKYHEMLPDQVIQWHDREHFPLIAAANVAAATADFLVGVNPIEPLQRLKLLTSRLYGFSERHLDEYLDNVNERLGATSDLLSADLSGLPPATELLACAVEQLSALSLQTLSHSQTAGGSANPTGDEILQLRAQLYELEKRSCLDALTGVYVRPYFDSRLAKRLRNAEPQPVVIGILFGDIDKFKRINDTYGHAAGDEVLKVVGSTMRSCVRSDDVVARYGGEEFAILVESSDPRVLEKLAERIRKEVADTTIRFGELEIKVTISLGGIFVPVVPDDRHIPRQDSLVRLADEAMYECKRRGGNAVTIRVWDQHAKTSPA